MANYLV
jgi:hypothetical protein